MAAIDDLSQADIQRLATMAGLELSDVELEQLVPQVKGLFGAIRRVHELDLGNTDPAVTFSLRERAR